MNEWREVTLGSISETISYGYTESASIEEVGPKFLRITDIASTRLKWNNVPYCPITDSNFEKYKLYPGDIVIARTGATTGANYILKPSDPKNVVYASYLIRYQIDNDLAYPFYVGHILQSITWKEFVKSIAGGSAQPGANAKELGSFEFLLPPLPEQKAIAEVLSSLDDKIDLLHRQNETLEQMAQTLFRQWFVEEAEDDWEEIEFGEFLTPQKGKNLTRAKAIDGPYPVVAGGLEPMCTHNKSNTEEPVITVSASGANAGFVRLYNQKVWSSDSSFIDKTITPYVYFSYLFLKFNQEVLFDRQTGSAQPHIYPKQIMELEFRNYPEHLIAGYDQWCEDLFNKIKFNQIQIQTLEKLRDTLLPKLMSGEVRVDL